MSSEPLPLAQSSSDLTAEASFKAWVCRIVKGAAELQAFEAGQIDAVMDPITGSAILLPEARAALQDSGVYGAVQLIIAGGIRDGVDAAKAMALGADACYIGTASLIALNCNKAIYEEDYRALGAAPHACHHCHTGRCPVGITTQDPELMKRLDIEAGAERVRNFLHVMTLEIQMLARSCGKSDVHHLEPEDMAALTLEASAICNLPLVGTRKVFGQ